MPWRKGYIAGVELNARGLCWKRSVPLRRRWIIPIRFAVKIKAGHGRNYDAAVRFTMDHLDRFEMFMGTHNEESKYKLAKLMDEKGIARDDSRVSLRSYWE